MSTTRDSSSVEEDSEEIFELQRAHAYTFPFLSPDIYGDTATIVTSQTSLLSRSSTPENSKPEHNPAEIELESLIAEQRFSESRFHEEISPQSTHRHRYSSPPSQKYISWGVSLRQPVIMVAFFLVGTSTALSHHLYYHGLMGSTAGNVAKQQWVIWIGTGLNNMTLFFLNSANGIALTQAIWWTVKRHALTVGGLDNLFGLFTDINGFVNLELLRRAKIAVPVAFVFWGMVLTAIIPPGTISVVYSSTPKQEIMPNFNVPTFNWTLATDEGGALLSFETFNGDGVVIAYPPPQTLRIASQVSQDIYVSPPASSPPNSTYTQQFLGPALQCNPANSLQQQAFDFYNEASFNETGIVTASQFFNNSDFFSFPQDYNFLQFFSAFSPQLYETISDVHPVPGETDHFNNWPARLPPNIRDIANFSNAEFWVQLADSSIVCTLMNSAFDIGFEDINGTQTVVQNNVTHIDKWVIGESEDNYLGVMAALAPMLYGNVTMIPRTCDVGNGVIGECYALSGSSSSILQTGISACAEFSNSWWSQNIDFLNKTHIFNPISFDTDPWMCRNGTVARALEDLSVNLTISLLGLDLDAFHPLPTPVTLIHYTTPNIYAYDSLKLFISYGSGIFATLICVCIGLLIFQSNGISHDTSFSAIMTTTRNPELDRLSVGQSLCAIGKELEETKLRFGGNRVGWELGRRLGAGDVERAAFGLEGKVGGLRKGGRYI